MKDPKPLAACDTTPFEKRLLDAARNERIPSEMMIRMSQGLNLGPAATAAGQAGALLSLKSGALIVLGTAALTGLVVFGLGRSAGPAGPREGAAATVAPPNPVVPASGVLRPAQVVAQPVPVPAPPPRGSPRTLASASTPRNREAALREEIGLLDAARAALAAHAPAKALVVLSQYNHRYPSGTFAPEALALRIEALANAGDTASARALARRFLKAYPTSPLAERVEQLTGLGR